MKQLSKFSLLFLAATSLCICPSCNKQVQNDDPASLDNAVAFAEAQIGLEIAEIEKSGETLNPITLKKDSTVFYGQYWDWRSGFFPGSLWYLYELTGKEIWAERAERWTNSISKAQYITDNHDVGFMVGDSFGNGLRLKNIESYKDTLITAARSLSTRFHPEAGVIQSWDVVDPKGWQGERGWNWPVIIDNMMNLELMFMATQLSGDSTFYNISISHADRTLKEHFREDGSCYHVVDYGTDGNVRSRETAQGFSDESTWSRGQAWAIYGYAMAYRFTGFERYLAQARKTFLYMMTHPNMAEDMIPYWDMVAPNIPDEPRDASSAAIIASAAYELAELDPTNAEEYRGYADKIMKSLASDVYRAKLGENGNFLLMHSTGSLPHGSEVDYPLNYADYYYLEALIRQNKK